MCVFCRIINKEIPSNIVYEDDKFLAIFDISQSTKGHTLVLPKKHFENIFELDDVTTNEIFGVVKKVSEKLKKAFNPDGFNMISNNGLEAGQSIFHFHIHIIPRYFGDDVSIILPNNSDKLEKNYFINLKEEMNKI